MGTMSPTPHGTPTNQAYSRAPADAPISTDRDAARIGGTRVRWYVPNTARASRLSRVAQLSEGRPVSQGSS